MHDLKIINYKLHICFNHTFLFLLKDNMEALDFNAFMLQTLFGYNVRWAVLQTYYVMNVILVLV